MMRKWTLSFAMALLLLTVAAPLALAAEEVEKGEAAGEMSATAVLGIALAGGIGIGIAAFGGALGQGRTAAAALEGIARNPGAAGKIQTPMIIGLALIESLVIYALLIALILVFKF